MPCVVSDRKFFVWFSHAMRITRDFSCTFFLFCCSQHSAIQFICSMNAISVDILITRIVFRLWFFPPHVPHTAASELKLLKLTFCREIKIKWLLLFHWISILTQINWVSFHFPPKVSLETNATHSIFRLVSNLFSQTHSSSMKNVLSWQNG